MKRFAVLATLIGCAASATLHAQEFDFRDATLGMTLNEFKALPKLNPPSVKTSFNCRASRVGAGKTECSRYGDAPFDGQFGATISTYLFGKDTGGVDRLYMIMLMANRNNFATALANLSEKWGQGESTDGAVTNGYGQEISQTTTVWKRANSKIELESPCGSVQRLCITYTHTKLSSETATPTENKF